MTDVLDKIQYRGWLRSWQLWFLGLSLAALILTFYPVKFGSLVLIMSRFFLLAGAGYICTRVFFPRRYHEMPLDDPIRQKRALGVYIFLAGCAIGAGSGAIG